MANLDFIPQLFNHRVHGVSRRKDDFRTKNSVFLRVLRGNFFLLLLLGGPLAAMDWPLPDAAMVRNFGFNDRGRPALGTVFEGEGEVLAADEGELIFSCSGKETASRFPSPLGAWAAVDHGDGLVSIYGRLGDESGSRQMTRAYRGVPIATAGSSGWSGRNGFYFLLYDRKERRWVNASMVITPFPDTVPPQIQGIQLRNADGRLLEGTQLRGVSQGRYTIVVNAVDTLLEPRGVPLAPHRIVCSVNGEEAGSLSFETISARDGVLMINRNGLIPAPRVYAHYPAFEAGEVNLSRGQAILEVIVQDITGNSRSALLRMIVE
jgi:murein DD-endopeptidase MepM/ murein hydrolase activator NlpD